MVPLNARIKRSYAKRKTVMKLIEDEGARAVAFSNRRAGVFNKASELSTLCGARVGLVVFSSCGRAYSFGHPTIGSDMNQFLQGNPTARGRFGDGAGLRQLKEQCDEMNVELDDKQNMKKGEAMKEKLLSQVEDERLSGLGLAELEDMKRNVEAFRERLRIGEALPGKESAAGKRQVSLKVDASDGSEIPSDWLKL